MIKKIYVLTSILFLFILSCTPKQNPTDNDMVKVKVNVITSYSSILPLNFYVAKEGSSDFKHIGTVTDKDTSDGNNYIYTFEVDPGISTVKITGTAWGDFTGEKIWHNMRFDIGKEYTIDAYFDDQSGKKSKIKVSTTYKEILPLKIYSSKYGSSYEYLGIIDETRIVNGVYTYTFNIDPGNYNIKITGNPSGNFTGEKIHNDIKFNIDDINEINMDNTINSTQLTIRSYDPRICPLTVSISRNNGKDFEFLGTIKSNPTSISEETFEIGKGVYDIKITGNPFLSFDGTLILKDYSILSATTIGDVSSVYMNNMNDARKQTNTYTAFKFAYASRSPVVLISKDNAEYKFIGNITDGQHISDSVINPNGEFDYFCKYLEPGQYNIKISWTSSVDGSTKEKIWNNEQLYAGQTKQFTVTSDDINQIEKQ